MTRATAHPPQDVFQIGDAQFTFADDAAITFVDGGMTFDLKAAPVAFDPVRHGAAFDPDHGPASPRFYLAGTFHFDDRSDEPHRVFAYPVVEPNLVFSLYAYGLRRDLRFHGQVDLAPDHVALHGVLRRDDNADSEGVVLHVVRHVQRGDVHLRPQVFDSIEAASAVAPERVRQLHWRQMWARGTPKVDAFPQEVLRWRRLEWLTLDFPSKDHARFTSLPDELGTLQALTHLHIGNTSVLRMPSSIGELKALRHLAFTHGALVGVPDSLGQLDQLETLDLSYNQLTSLPECIGHLPALKCLDLRGNAFVSLPASIDRIADLRVDPRHLALFRDTRYRPDVDVAIDAEVFLARSSPPHLALLKAALRRHGLETCEPTLRRHARQALRWRTTVPDDPPVTGNTRFGGAPDLPPGVAYPTTDGRYWHFYAQLDLDAIAPLQSWLPRTGRLYFFAEGQESQDKTLVLFDTSPRTALRPHVWAEGVRFVDGDNVPEPYGAYRATVDATVSVPGLWGGAKRYAAEDVAALREIDDDQEQRDAYLALETELGGSDDDQHGVHVQNGHVFTQQESPEEQAMAVAGGQADEWVNLLTLYSDQHPGFSFWDAGTLTFTIHRKDLALADFSRVQVSLESF